MIHVHVIAAFAKHGGRGGLFAQPWGSVESVEEAICTW